MSSNEDYIFNGRPLSDLRVVDLKDLLDQRGLSKSGSKVVLIKRLKDALVLEQSSTEAIKDPDSVPNMDMKSSGSNIVAKYLEEQQRALLTAKKAAREARAAEGGHNSSSCSTDDTVPMGNGRNNSESDANETKSELFKPESGTESVEKTNGSATIEKCDENVEMEHRDLKESPIKDVPDAEKRELKSPEQVESIVNAENVELVEDEQLLNQVAVQPSHQMEEEEKPIAVASAEKEESTSSAFEDDDKDVEPKDDGDDEIAEAVDATSAADQNNEIQKTNEIKYGSQNQTSDDENLQEKFGDSSPSQSESDKDESPAHRRIDRFISEHDDVKNEAAEVQAKDELQELATVIEKPQKKRRWGSTTVGKSATVSISSDCLQEIVGHIKTTTEKSLSIEDALQLDYDEEPAPKRIVVKKEESDDEEDGTTTTAVEQQPKEASKSKISHEKPKRLLVEPTFDEGFKRDRSASPARRPVSDIVHVRCLTRPFTIKGLHHFLNRFGTFIQDSFWIDAIKSHCFVKYESEEIAKNARENLDNVTWPLSNPNRLRADFSTEDDLERYRNRSTKENEKPATKAAVLIGQSNMENLRNKDRSVKEISTNELEKVRRTIERSPNRSNADESKLWPKSREWDRGKDSHRGLSSSPNRIDRKRLSPSNIRKTVREEPAVTLIEDLFRKTKTTPHIYWLPVSHEQITARQNTKMSKDDQKIELLKKMAFGDSHDFRRTDVDDSMEFDRDRNRSDRDRGNRRYR